MPVLNHTHKLKLYENRLGNKIFFCADNKCTFKVPQKMALGKLCICWRCYREFELTPYSYALVKPHCPSCTRTKGAKENAVVNSGEAKKVIFSLSDRLHRSSEGSSTAVADSEDDDIL